MVKRLNEDFLDDQIDDVLLQSDEQESLPAASFNSGFQYRWTLWYSKTYKELLNPSYDKAWLKSFDDVYVKIIRPLYKFMERYLYVDGYSEAMFMTSPEKGWTYTAGMPELTERVREDWYIKSANLRFDIYFNARFTPSRLLYFTLAIGRVTHCHMIESETSDGRKAKLSSTIPLNSTLGRTQKDLEYWFNAEEGLDRSENSARLTNIYQFVLDICGYTVKNYESVKREMGYDLVPLSFDVLVSSVSMKRPKHFALKKSIEEKLNNGILDLGEFFRFVGHGVGDVYLHPVTAETVRSFDKYHSMATNARDYVIDGMGVRQTKILKWDIFIHDIRSSYGRYVSAVFYVGPGAYKKPSGKSTVTENFLVMSDYDARDDWFASVLSDVLVGGLTADEQKWLTEKLKKTK